MCKLSGVRKEREREIKGVERKLKRGRWIDGESRNESQGIAPILRSCSG